MALTTIEYIYSGQATFPVNFALGNLSREYVTVRVNFAVDGAGDPLYYSDYSWISDSEILINGLIIGDTVSITRTIPKDNLVSTFSEGADVTRKNLDAQSKQAIMGLQEILDGRFDSDEAPTVSADRAEAAASSVSSLIPTINTALQTLTDVAELRVEGQARSYVLSDGSVWATDGTTGHTVDEDDGGVAVVNVGTGVLYKRQYDGLPSLDWFSASTETKPISKHIIRPYEIRIKDYMLEGERFHNPAANRAILRAFELGESAVMDPSGFDLNGSIVYDDSARTVDTLTGRRPVVNIKGQGSGLSPIRLFGQFGNPAFPAFDYIGPSSGKADAFLHWEGFYVTPTLAVDNVATEDLFGVRPSGASIIRAENMAYAIFSDIKGDYLDTAFDMQDFLTSVLDNCMVRFCTRAFHMRNDAFDGVTGTGITSDVNAVTLNNFIMAACREESLLEGVNSFQWRGGTAEGCGLDNLNGDDPNVSTTGAGVLRIEDTGTQGGGNTIDGVYIEGNRGLADIIWNAGTDAGGLVMKGCTAQRYLANQFTKTMVKFTRPNTTSTLYLRDTAFEDIAPYAQTTARPYWDAPLASVEASGLVFTSAANIPLNTLTPNSARRPEYTKAELASVDPGLYPTGSALVSNGTTKGYAAIATSTGTQWRLTAALSETFLCEWDLANTEWTADLPTGWTLTTSPNGQALITHNLGNLDYVVDATSYSGLTRIDIEVVNRLTLQLAIRPANHGTDGSGFTDGQQIHVTLTGI